MVHLPKLSEPNEQRRWLVVLYLRQLAGPRLNVEPAPEPLEELPL